MGARDCPARLMRLIIGAMPRLSLPAVLVAALGLVLALGGAVVRAEGSGAPASSLHAFVEDLAAALEARARLEGAAGPVRIEVEASWGIDALKVERAFTTRLSRRLKEGGVLIPAQAAPLTCRITISQEGGLVWATAVLEGAALAGPAAVASSSPVDRELQASLGALVKPAQTRYVLERLGAVPVGVLDAALIDADSDGIDELALLGVDGLRLYRVGSERLERLGSVIPLATDKRWPRVLAGWLARLDREPGGSKSLWVVTSAGHSLLWDVRAQRSTAAPPDVVPLRGTSGPLLGGWRLGSPLVALPLASLNASVVRAPGLPSRVRDLAAVPGSAGAWIYIDDQGQLLAQRGGAPPALLAGERVGDRLLLADLDGDGEVDLLTTSASPPSDPDHLVLRRLAADLSSSAVVFRSPLAGGSIAAIAAGHLDVSAARLDVVLIEELGQEALAWRLRYAP